MTKTKLFATAAVMSALMMTPVFAQNASNPKGKGLKETSQNTSQRTRQQMKNTSIRPNVRVGARADEMTERNNFGWDSRGWDNRGWNSGDYRRADTGFFPLDAAVGLTSGAVATAGAIAASPFTGPTYAYNDGYRTNDGYARGPGYRDTYASVDSYPRVGAFASQPYTNPYERNRVADNTGLFGQNYAQRNSFVCVPGTVFTNENGKSVLCQ